MFVCVIELLNFLRTGNYNRAYGNLNEPVTNGNWWSSVAGSSTNGHNLNTNPGNVNAQNNNLRGNGFALRCVARAASSTLYFLRPNLFFFEYAHIADVGVVLY